MSQQIWSPRCWGCRLAMDDPNEKKVCPLVEQHWKSQREREKKWE